MKPSSDAPDAFLESGFAADFEGEGWLERVRRAEAPVEFGRIGEYELEEEVSRGGQGVVFRARQPGTNRRIALKRLLAGHFSTVGMRRRFEREIEAAASLNHPNIVTIYGAETVDDTPVFAMEWIDGVPATDWARGRAHDEVLELFLRIADAVRHAHSRGVLHRDIKPSNVLVDEVGQPHLLDFGLAKRGAFDAAGEPEVSKSAEVFGTPAYAAPEQLTANETSVDARSDVYSLGVLLFEMLTGSSPYGEWNGIADLLRRVGSVRPPRLASVDPRLGDPLDTIVRTAMASEREERYASVEAFAGDVRRYLGGESIVASAPSSWVLLQRLVASNPVVSGLAAALVLFAVGFGAHASWQARRLAEKQERLERALAEAEERGNRLASVMAYVPDCMTYAETAITAAVAKPGTLLDRSVGLSSPNPYYVPKERSSDPLPEESTEP